MTDLQLNRQQCTLSHQAATVAELTTRQCYQEGTGQKPYKVQIEAYDFECQEVADNGIYSVLPGDPKSSNSDSSKLKCINE